jgi:hypothetical protein
MTLILGDAARARTEMSYVFALAGLSLVLYKIIETNFNARVLKAIIPLGVIALLMFGFRQSLIINRMYYTEAQAFEADKVLFYRIRARIEEVVGTSKVTTPVVFVNGYEQTLNPDAYAITQLELIGRPISNIQLSTTHSTFVKNNFNSALGIRYTLPDTPNYNAADEIQAKMPAWPAKDSVQLYKDTIVVKMGG